MRSNSRPGYFRTGSKNIYMRDNSSFYRQGSGFRYASKPRQNSKPGSGSVLRGSSERPKSEMFRKVEKIDKNNEELKKELQEIKEMLKTINTQYVLGVIVINVKYVNEGQERLMLIDSGAPKSIVSSRWLEGYL